MFRLKTCILLQNTQDLTLILEVMDFGTGLLTMDRTPIRLLLIFQVVYLIQGLSSLVFS